MKFSRSMRRLLLGFLAVQLLAAGLFVFWLANTVKDRLVHDAKKNMDVFASLLIQHIDELELKLSDPSLPRLLEKAGERSQMNFSLIRGDGEVVAGSRGERQNVEVQLTKEEFLEAEEQGVGFSVRRSEPLGAEMMFFVRRLDFADASESNRSGYVGVAAPLAPVTAFVAKVRRAALLFTMAMAAFLAFLIALYALRNHHRASELASVAKMIGGGSYDGLFLSKSRNDDWRELEDAFEQMQQELMRRESRLVESGQRLEAVLSSMIEGVIAIEPAGKVMLANSAACKMLSITQSKLVGRKMEEVRIAELTSSIDMALLNRSSSKTEFTTTTDPKRTIKARVSLLKNAEKSGVAVVLHDVTELRQLETMRQDFVANVSHELKTPLASIKAYAETLKMGALHDDTKNLQFVEQIEFQADILNHQIQDLLQLARVESGRKTFSVSDVDLNRSCESLHHQFERAAEFKNLDLLLELEQPGPVAICDAEAIETVIGNLIVNAIHYTPDGGSVRIKTFTDGDQVAVAVSDTGIGIATDQQSRVFERFYRVDKARSRDMGGTGLGLAIVKHLTQAFGGSVALDSKLGKGSTFRVSMPASRKQKS